MAVGDIIGLKTSTTGFDEIILNSYFLGTNAIGNESYGSSWDGVTNQAPSKNAIYDAGFVTGTPWTAMGYVTAAHTHDYDKYTSWTLQANGANGTAITSGGTVNFIGAGATTLSKAANAITITSVNTWVANALNTAGYVAAPASTNANHVWKCDANGNPAWRAESSTPTYSLTTDYLPRWNGTTFVNSLVVNNPQSADWQGVGIKSSGDVNYLYVGQVSNAWGYVGHTYYQNSAMWRSKRTSSSSIIFNDGETYFVNNTGLTANTDYTPTKRLSISPSGIVSILTTTASTSSSTGALTIAGGLGVGGTLNISGVTNILGGSTLGLTIRSNGIQTEEYNGADIISMNYRGYANGTTQFRNFSVFDGKQAPIMQLVGSDKSATFLGKVNANHIGITGTANVVANTPSSSLELQGGGIAHSNIVWLPNEKNIEFHTSITGKGTDDYWGAVNLKTNGNISSKTFYSFATDNGMILQSYNISASGSTQFRIYHNYGDTIIDVNRGNLYLYGTASNSSAIGGIEVGNIFAFKGNVTTNSNANTLATGFYINTTGNGTGNSNYPTNWDYGVTTSYDAGYFKYQSHIHSNGSMLNRAYSGGTWGGWRTLWDSLNSNKNDVDWNVRGLYANGYVSLNSYADNDGDGLPWYGLGRPSSGTVRLTGYYGLELKTNSGLVSINGFGDLMTRVIKPINNTRSDGGYGGIDFYDNGLGYGMAAKIYTFKSSESGEYYGLTQDWSGSGAQLSIISKYDTGSIQFYTGNSGNRESDRILTLYPNKIAYFNHIVKATNYRFNAGSYELGIYNGRFSFTNEDVAAEKGVNMGSLLVSNVWSDADKVPTNGIWSKGAIKTADSVVINSGSPTLYLQDTDQNSAMVHVNSNTFYILRGGVNSMGWTTVGSGYWPLTIDLTNNNAVFGGTLTSIYNMYTPNVVLTSDVREKTNIRPLIHSDNVDRINWVEFEMINDVTRGRRAGVIAQELESILPQFVDTDDDAKQTKRVKYIDLLVTVVAKLQSDLKLANTEINQLKQILCQ